MKPAREKTEEGVRVVDAAEQLIEEADALDAPLVYDLVNGKLVRREPESDPR